MGNTSITWRPENGFQGQVKELTMITINILDEEVVEQPMKPSTQNETGEIKQKNEKFSLLNKLSRWLQKSNRQENQIRMYQDSEWIAHERR
jgi:hypothetical protein